MHVDGFVDSYYGPREFADRVNASAPADPRRLVDDAIALAEDVAAEPDINDRRKQWLLSQVGACETVARRLAGEEMSWSAEVERCFSTRFTPLGEERFADAHALLDDVLPGDGPLPNRYRQWLESQAVPRELLIPAAERLAEMLRRRAHELAPLPDDEDFELELIEGEPWSAFNYYLGDHRSRVVINADALMWSPSLTDLVAHELYPGHHTEHSCKEGILVRRRGWLEETIALVLTPQSLVAEGIATLALEVAFGSDAHTIAAGLLQPIGLSYDHETATYVDKAESTLTGVILNVAYQLHEQSREPAEVRDYALRWSLKPPELVDRMLAFAADDTWRTYVGTYFYGQRLCRAFVGSDEQKFARLLAEQFVPADLIGES
jgi:hypothetical protein